LGLFGLTPAESRSDLGNKQSHIFILIHMAQKAGTISYDRTVDKRLNVHSPSPSLIVINCGIIGGDFCCGSVNPAVRSMIVIVLIPFPTFSLDNPDYAGIIWFMPGSSRFCRDNPDYPSVPP
jgi:hypothetical protein